MYLLVFGVCWLILLNYIFQNPLFQMIVTQNILNKKGNLLTHLTGSFRVVLTSSMAETQVISFEFYLAVSYNPPSFVAWVHFLVFFSMWQERWPSHLQS